MGIFMMSCSYSECQYSKYLIFTDEKGFYRKCFCTLDDRKCDFDSSHPSSISCRHFKIFLVVSVLTNGGVILHDILRYTGYLFNSSFCHGIYSCSMYSFF